MEKCREQRGHARTRIQAKLNGKQVVRCILFSRNLTCLRGRRGSTKRALHKEIMSLFQVSTAQDARSQM